MTITVSQNAVAAHVRNHGDTIGPCSDQAAPVVPVVPGQAKKAVKVHKAHKAKHANKGHQSKPSQAANSNAPAAPPGQVKSGPNGRSAAAPAYGSGKKG